jgi:hypothetical protein
MTSNDLWNELGLTGETQYKPEAIAFWLQHPPKEFLEVIATELMNPAASIKGCADILQQNSTITSVTVNSRTEVTVQQLLTIILNSQTVIEDIAKLLRQYARTADFTESSSES